MTRLPAHLANDRPPGGSPTPIRGLDLSLAAQNVRLEGGDPSRFAASLAAAQHEDAGMDAARGLALVSLAAWRAGALALRDDALSRLDVLLAGEPSARLAAAAALSLDVGVIDAFAGRQRTDRFWWPGRDASRGYVCAVGGFAGLGGAWIEPPVGSKTLAEPGAFAILTGTQWWRLDADVWGARLVAIDDEPEDAASATPVTIVHRRDSYLAWVHARDAA